MSTSTNPVEPANLNNKAIYFVLALCGITALGLWSGGYLARNIASPQLVSIGLGMLLLTSMIFMYRHYKRTERKGRRTIALMLACLFLFMSYGSSCAEADRASYQAAVAQDAGTSAD